MSHILRILIINKGNPQWITVNWYEEDLGKPTRSRISSVLTAFMEPNCKPVAYLLTDSLQYSVLDEWRDDEYFSRELNL